MKIKDFIFSELYVIEQSWTLAKRTVNPQVPGSSTWWVTISQRVVHLPSLMEQKRIVAFK